MFAFKFVPKSEAEIVALNTPPLLEEGVYPFIVREVTQESSKAGNPMLKVKLEVLAHDKSRRLLTDYLLATDKMIYKLKHFCDAVGFEKEYEQGHLELNKCVNRGGRVKIGIQKGTVRDDGSLFADKNVIKDYTRILETVAQVTVQKHDTFNDDITF